MNDATSRALEQAFEHIEAGRPDDAIPLLEPIVADDPDNLDAWWMLVHASSDPQAARRALNNVLRLDPDYPGAAMLLDTLNEKYPAPRIRQVEAVSAPETMPEAPTALPEPPPAAPPPLVPPARQTAKAAPTPPARRSGLPMPLLAVAAVILVFVVLLILLTGDGGGGSAGSENVAQTQTTVALLAVSATETPSIVVVDASPTPETILEVTNEVTPEATSEPVIGETPEATSEPVIGETPEATTDSEQTPDVEVTAEMTAEAGGGTGGEDFSGILSALSRYTLPDAPVEVVDTSLGSTLLASVCSAPGREARTRVEEVLTLAARESAALPESIDAVGARMVNCDDGATILALGVDRATAVGFAQRSVSARDFAAAWRPVR